MGHIKSVFKTGYCLNTISSEGYAWEVGINLAFDNGFVYEYNSKEMKYARERLETYRNNNDNWK